MDFLFWDYVTDMTSRREKFFAAGIPGRSVKRQQRDPEEGNIELPAVEASVNAI